MANARSKSGFLIATCNLGRDSKVWILDTYFLLQWEIREWGLGFDVKQMFARWWLGCSGMDVRVEGLASTAREQYVLSVTRC